MHEFTWLSILSLIGGAEIPSVHGADGAAGGGLVGLLDQMLAQLTRLIEPGQPSFRLMPGIAGLAYNLHPLIVHFPIAFLGAFLPLELAGMILNRQSLRSIASWMLYLGAVAAAMAAGAGLVAESRVPHGAEVHEIMEWHGRLGLTVATLSAALAIWRFVAKERFSSIMARTLHLGLAAVMTICLVIGADLGGLMVYQHGVGVKQLQQVDDHHHMAPETTAAPSRTP